MMEDKVLFVDDDPNILAAYKRQLRNVLRVDTAEGPKKGLQLVRDWGPFAVVIADMHMPAMNGIEFLARVGELAPDTVRMMLTGAPDLEIAMQAVNDGSVFRFLTKPCPPQLMGKALVAGINQYRLIRAEKELLEQTLRGTIDLLVEILSLTDPETFGRVPHLRNRARALGRTLKLANPWELELAATLSQIGHVATPRDLLAKSRAGDPLSDVETDVFERSPQVAHDLLAKIPRLESVAKIVLYHSKCYDGSGFPPDSVAGSEIPLESRVLNVLTDIQELERRGVAKDAVVEEMQNRPGRYDPRALAAALRGYTPFKAMHEEKGIDLPLSELRAGLTLLSNIETLDNRLLVGAGHVITELVLARIRTYAKLVGVKEPIEIRCASAQDGPRQEQ